MIDSLTVQRMLPALLLCGACGDAYHSRDGETYTPTPQAVDRHPVTGESTAEPFPSGVETARVPITERRAALPEGGSAIAGSAGNDERVRTPNAGTGTDSGAGTDGAAATDSGDSAPVDGATAAELLVAFIGDQGTNEDAGKVLELIREEGAAATLHNGDFDYHDDPADWDARISAVLGDDYPYFALVGNHDALAWDGEDGYEGYIGRRIARVPSMQCSGEPGVRASCHFRGLHLIQSCVGTYELEGHGDCTKDSPEQVQFIEKTLADDDSIWSVCAWHKNQNDMQIGTKPDDVGWAAYRACQAGGAFVATGHEHSYARTLSLADLGNTTNGHGALGTGGEIDVGPGRTFVFVSGLGGMKLRSYDVASHDDDTWWATYYAANRWLLNGALQEGTSQSGALFIRFNVKGDPRRAIGYFKDIDGRVADEFEIRAKPSPWLGRTAASESDG